MRCHVRRARRARRDRRCTSRRRKTLAPGEEPKRRLELPGLELDLTGNNFDYEKELAKDEERPRPQPANQKHREAVQRLYAEAVANRRKAMERLQMAPESFLSQQAPSLLGRAAAVDVRPSDALFRISLDDGSATPRPATAAAAAARPPRTRPSQGLGAFASGDDDAHRASVAAAGLRRAATPAADWRARSETDGGGGGGTPRGRLPLSMSDIAWRYPTKQSSLIADEGEFGAEYDEDDDDDDENFSDFGDDEPAPLPVGFTLREIGRLGTKTLI